MMILLPGIDKQLKFLFEKCDVSGKNILVAGSFSEEIALSLAHKSGRQVELIVEDYDSLLSSKLLLNGSTSVNIKLMEFEATDFRNDSFDLVYAQASISRSRRNKILKEIKNILKSGGIFCAGEIIKLKNKPPTFVEDILNSSDLNPLYVDELESYYSERNFEIIASLDLGSTLKDYYLSAKNELTAANSELSGAEKSFHKKLINKISHEANAYLKLGGDKYIGFSALIMKKM